MGLITTKKHVELLLRNKRKTRPNARPKVNKITMTRALDEAMIMAAAETQQARDNGGGLVGYFKHLAISQPDLMARLLGLVMDEQEKERAEAARQQNQ